MPRNSTFVSSQWVVTKKWRKNSFLGFNRWLHLICRQFNIIYTRNKSTQKNFRAVREFGVCSKCQMFWQFHLNVSWSLASSLRHMILTYCKFPFGRHLVIYINSFVMHKNRLIGLENILGKCSCSLTKFDLIAIRQIYMRLSQQANLCRY